MSLTKASYSMITGAPVNVKDFGATGDGTTDDTAAIQAAINFCTNLSNRRQTLYFPANNASLYYKTTAPLVVNGRLNIVGDGEFSTTILAVGLTAGQFILDFDNLAVDNVYFGGLQNITIRSNDAAPNGIRLKNTSYWTLKNVQLYDLDVGIYITGTQCFSNFFEQVTHYEISGYSVQFDAFTGGGQYQFLGCTFTGNDGF
jgi:polygalacturonase